MKTISNNFKKLCLLTILILSSMLKGHSQMIDGGVLDEVTISCKRVVAYQVSVFGLFNYTKYAVICNNGYESYFDYFW